MVRYAIQYNYGKKEWGTNYIGQDGFLRNFLKLGHEVVEFYYDDYLNNIEQILFSVYYLGIENINLFSKYIYIELLI